MKVTTTRKSTATGRPVIVAKADGKQKQTNWDLSKSSDWNHGTAAANLLLHMTKHSLKSDVSALVKRLDTATHDSNDAGTQHVFNI